MHNSKFGLWLVFFVVIAVMPSVALAQTCDCSKIIVVCQAPVQPNDPCAGLSTGSCGSCTCTYIEMMNTSACTVDSIDISAGEGACSNYCGYLKDEAGAMMGDPCYDHSMYNGVWDETPPRPATCKSMPPTRFKPHSGPPPQDPMMPSPACSSNFIIKVCSTTPGTTYTITLYFHNDGTCTKTCTF